MSDPAKRGPLRTVTYTFETPRGLLTLRTICGNVSREDNEGFSIARMWFALADEGVRWIRGARGEQDDDGKALLVAWALSGASPLAASPYPGIVRTSRPGGSN